MSQQQQQRDGAQPDRDADESSRDTDGDGASRHRDGAAGDRDAHTGGRNGDSYASGSFHQVGTPIGDITINFPSPGNFVGSVQNVPNPNIARVDFTGTATTSQINMNYTITFTAAAGGGSAIGTMVLSHVS